jgi:ribose/xylose/arabinose/galactoside ABC-type transport system permease subunit
MTRAIRRLNEDIELTFAVGVLAALFVVFSLSSPYFLTSQNLSNVLVQSVVLAIVAFGVTVVIITGHFDLSVGSGVGLSAVVSAEVMLSTNSTLLGVLAALGTGIGIGLVNGILVAVFGVPSFIATLGMLVMARGLALAVTNGETKFGFPLTLSEFLQDSFLGIKNSIWLALATLVAFHLFLRHTRRGVELYAVGGNVRAARLTGLPVARLTIFAFMLSGFAVGLASLATLGRLGAAQPGAGALLELFSVAAVVLGGTSLYGGSGSVLRTVIGVALIVVIQNGLTLLNVNSDYEQVILGAVFILATLSGVIRRRA